MLILHIVHKLTGENIEGSPFPVYFSSMPDPTKVKVYGSGIEHGILSRFKSNFVVDTRGAGAGQLTVRMRGPKGIIKLNTNSHPGKNEEQHIFRSLQR